MACERRGREQTVSRDTHPGCQRAEHTAEPCRWFTPPGCGRANDQCGPVLGAGFTAMHAYWYLGGRVGFGDQPDPLPSVPSSLGDWIFNIVVGGMFAASLMVPIAFTRSWGRHALRSGQLDDGVRFTGLCDGGLTGLGTQNVLGSAHPSRSTKVSTVAIDTIFFIGGILSGCGARLGGFANTANAIPGPYKTLDVAAGTKRAGRRRGVADRRPR